MGPEHCYKILALKTKFGNETFTMAPKLPLKNETQASELVGLKADETSRTDLCFQAGLGKQQNHPGLLLIMVLKR